ASRGDGRGGAGEGRGPRGRCGGEGRGRDGRSPPGARGGGGSRRAGGHGDRGRPGAGRPCRRGPLPGRLPYDDAATERRLGEDRQEGQEGLRNVSGACIPPLSPAAEAPEEQQAAESIAAAVDWRPRLTIASCHAGAECPAPAIGVALLVPRIAARSSEAELP